MAIVGNLPEAPWYWTALNGFGSLSVAQGEISFEILEGCEDGVVDECGICGGDNTTCVMLADACGECMAGGENC